MGFKKQYACRTLIKSWPSTCTSGEPPLLDPPDPQHKFEKILWCWGHNIQWEFILLIHSLWNYFEAAFDLRMIWYDLIRFLKIWIGRCLQLWIQASFLAMAFHSEGAGAKDKASKICQNIAKGKSLTSYLLRRLSSLALRVHWFYSIVLPTAWRPWAAQAPRHKLAFWLHHYSLTSMCWDFGIGEWLYCPALYRKRSRNLGIVNMFEAAKLRPASLGLDHWLGRLVWGQSCLCLHLRWAPLEPYDRLCQRPQCTHVLVASECLSVAKHATSIGLAENKNPPSNMSF